ASLLEVRDPALEPLAVACGRRFRVASRVTSFAFAEEDDPPATVGVAAAVERAWADRGQDEGARARARVRVLLRESVPADTARRAGWFRALRCRRDTSIRARSWSAHSSTRLLAVRRRTFRARCARCRGCWSDPPTAPRRRVWRPFGWWAWASRRWRPGCCWLR